MMRFQIRHLSGSKAGQEEILEGVVITVGRDPSNMLRFDPHVDDRVSTNHAQILVQDNGQVLLTDLGSSNGTFIGEQKVSAPIPLMTGALVRFGDGGPQVSITFLPPEAPAAPAEPEKKGLSKGLLIGIIVAAVLLLGCCITSLVMYLSSGDEQVAEAPEDAPETPDAPTEDTPVTDDDTPKEEPPKEEPPKEEPKEETKGDEWESPWAKLGVGTVFEFKTVTDMEVAGNKMKTESGMKQTLKAKDDDEATIETETIMANVPPNKSEMKLKLHGEAGEEGEKPEYLEEKETEVEVPAGKFSCTYRKWKTNQGGKETTMEMWMDQDLPVAYKTVMVNEMMTSTTELVSMDKK